MNTPCAKDEREWIARARGGDEAALTKLIDVHTERLLASIRAELGDKIRSRLESRDVMQQVYLDALGGIDRFEQREHDGFFRWLRAIAVNRIRDVGRREFGTAKRGPEVRAADIGTDASMARLLGDVAGSMTSPSGVVDRTDRIHLLQAALGRLGEDQRRALQLRYLSQLDVPETARRMGRSERAVRGLCVRALIRLREILGDVV